MEIDRPVSKRAGNFPWIHAAASVAILLCLTIPLSACGATKSGPSPASSQETQSFPSTAPAVTAAQDTLPTSEDLPGPTVETTAIPTFTDLPIPTGTPLPFGSCTDGLTFMGDLTYPDRTKVLPGQLLEKRWKVRNSGSCDWGPEYRFRWTGGTKLADRDEFALYPAAAGSEAVIIVTMTAPAVPGEYTSDWRAFSPLGVPFGDALYIDIIVAE